MAVEISVHGIMDHTMCTCGVCHTMEGDKMMQAVREGVIFRFGLKVT